MAKGYKGGSSGDGWAAFIAAAGVAAFEGFHLYTQATEISREKTEKERLQSQVRGLQSALTEKNNMIASTTQELTNERNKNAQLQTSLNTVERDKAELGRRVNAFEQGQLQDRATIEALKREVAALKAKQNPEAPKS